MSYGSEKRKKDRWAEKLTKKYNNLALILIVNISGYKAEVRVFVAWAVEKGPGSFRPMGAELRLFKVGVLHFVALDTMQS